MSKNDPLEAFKGMQQDIEQRRDLVEKIQDSFSDLDTTLNFKVNSLLKTEFEKVCKKTHSNPSRELKLFMLRSIKTGRL
ncbi:hypothetical protein [Acinetobacter sp. ANC 3832]|uniref:hypothetical protein n=1 Tax=Acinetobacter sp. ANC 3832 TaxID=1977874 RepID=UPI000A332269|nr:hypothetical protein [Acinetobacter sp. ANC 3832]OTG85811.1 hypothetical protein B9T35_18150 [Acinetobacter sp. ANC 3832]